MLMQPAHSHAIKALQRRALLCYSVPLTHRASIDAQRRLVHTLDILYVYIVSNPTNRLPSHHTHYATEATHFTKSLGHSGLEKGCEGSTPQRPLPLLLCPMHTLFSHGHLAVMSGPRRARRPPSEARDGYPPSCADAECRHAASRGGALLSDARVLAVRLAAHRLAHRLVL
jgi:hypothetical protein